MATGSPPPRAMPAALAGVSGAVMSRAVRYEKSADGRAARLGAKGSRERCDIFRPSADANRIRFKGFGSKRRLSPVRAPLGSGAMCGNRPAGASLCVGPPRPLCLRSKGSPHRDPDSPPHPDQSPLKRLHATVQDGFGSRAGIEPSDSAYARPGTLRPPARARPAKSTPQALGTNPRTIPNLERISRKPNDMKFATAALASL